MNEATYFESFIEWEDGTREESGPMLPEWAATWLTQHLDEGEAAGKVELRSDIRQSAQWALL